MRKSEHSNGRSLGALVRDLAQQRPDDRAYTFVAGSSEGDESISWGELDQRAQRVAGALQARGLSNERILLLFPAGLEFLVAFFGCLYARCIAVPLPLPNKRRASF